MAPLTWKLLLSTATLAGGQHCAANDSCEDQTALLQSHLASHKSSLANAESQAQMLNFPKMSTLADPTKRHTALAQFEHTALELAQNMAMVTPEVVQVCQMTTELLTDTVLSAIESEHDTDQAVIDAGIGAFDHIEATRLDYESQILAAASGVGLDWSNHVWSKSGEGCIADVIQCRQELSQICLNCFSCIENCTSHWEGCEHIDTELEEAHAEVIRKLEEHSEPHCDEHGGIHAPDSATYEAMVDITDHLANKAAMEAYIALIAEREQCVQVEVAACQYHRQELDANGIVVSEGEVETCTHMPADGSDVQDCSEHITNRGTCEATATSCQASSCAASTSIAHFLELYQEAFREAVLVFYRAKARVEITEADRKVEWDTLERVICLLNTLTNDEAGSASSSTTEARIAACQADDIPEITVGVIARGTEHLNINYPTLPSISDLPPMPPTPCEDDYGIITCSGVEPCEDGFPPLCGGDQSIIDIFYPPAEQVDEVCECSAVAPTPLCPANEDGTPSNSVECLAEGVYPMPNDSGITARPYAATDQQRAAVASMMVAPPFAAESNVVYADQSTGAAAAEAQD